MNKSAKVTRTIVYIIGLGIVLFFLFILAKGNSIMDVAVLIIAIMGINFTIVSIVNLWEGKPKNKEVCKHFTIPEGFHGSESILKPRARNEKDV